MIGFLANIAPILLGFLGKLLALKSQAASDNQRLMLESMQAREVVLDKARDRADKESPMAAWNRRVIILVILALRIFRTSSVSVKAILLNDNALIFSFLQRSKTLA